MKPKAVNTNITPRNLLYVLLATVVILLVPFIAMQFSDQILWSPADFLIMGTLVFGFGLLTTVAYKKAGRYKVPLIVGIVILFLYIWIELAVGLLTHLGS